MCATNFNMKSLVSVPASVSRMFDMVSPRMSNLRAKKNVVYDLLKGPNHIFET